MIGEIAKKEFIELTRDGRFRLTSLIVFSLLVISFLVGIAVFRRLKNFSVAE